MTLTTSYKASIKTCFQRCRFKCTKWDYNVAPPRLHKLWPEKQNKQKRQIQILQILQILQSLVLQTLHQTSFKFVGKKKQNNLLPTNFHFNNVPAFRMKRKTSWRRQFAKMFIFHLYLFLYLNLFTSFRVILKTF